MSRKNFPLNFQVRLKLVQLADEFIPAKEASLGLQYIAGSIYEFDAYLNAQNITQKKHLFDSYYGNIVAK